MNQRNPLEDKRTLAAVLISIALIMFYSSMVVEPYQKQQQAYHAAEKARIAAEQQATPTLTPVLPAISTTSPAEFKKPTAQPTLAEISTHPTITVETDRLRLVISQIGGRLISAQLKDYLRELKGDTPIDVVRSADGAPLPLGVYVGSVSDASTQYRVAGAADAPGSSRVLQVDDAGATLSLEGTLPNGLPIQKTYSFKNGSYLFELAASVPSAPSTESAWIEWSQVATTEEAADSYNPKIMVRVAKDGKVDRNPFSSVAAGVTGAGPQTWAGVTDQYFLKALVPVQENSVAYVGKLGDAYLTRITGNPHALQARVFTGPKDYTLLKEEGGDLRLYRAVDLGVMAFLAEPLLSIIRFFFKLLGNYGLAIVALTLVIKMIFLPLTRAGMKSMQAMQDLQPEMKALRERIQDPTQLNQEMMALYKRRGVNPLGGCLPMLIQIPVFLGLYSALSQSIEMRHAPFALWIQDLSSPEHLAIFGIPVPVMVLLMGISMFIQQWTTPTPSIDPMQKKIFMLMPVIFTASFIIYPFPAGLVLYWLVNNTISIIQQVLLRKNKETSPLVATSVASLAIFGFAFLLTRL